MTRTLCEYMEMMRWNSGKDSTLDRIDVFLSLSKDHSRYLACQKALSHILWSF